MGNQDPSARAHGNGYAEIEINGKTYHILYTAATGWGVHEGWQAQIVQHPSGRLLTGYATADEALDAARRAAR